MQTAKGSHPIGRLSRFRKVWLSDWSEPVACSLHVQVIIACPRQSLLHLCWCTSVLYILHKYGRRQYHHENYSLQINSNIHVGLILTLVTERELSICNLLLSPNLTHKSTSPSKLGADCLPYIPGAGYLLSRRYQEYSPGN